MVKEQNTTDGVVSTLGLLGATREDSDRYFCIASNAYGRDEMTIHLYIQGISSYIVAASDSTILSIFAEPPDFPRNLRVKEKGSRYIKLGWSSSQDGNSPITQYIIEYKTESGMPAILSY